MYTNREDIEKWVVRNRHIMEERRKPENRLKNIDSSGMSLRQMFNSNDPYVWRDYCKEKRLPFHYEYAIELLENPHLFPKYNPPE
jgi:hypothetical protein